MPFDIKLSILERTLNVTKQTSINDKHFKMKSKAGPQSSKQVEKGTMLGCSFDSNAAETVESVHFGKGNKR